jgi:hypothetical protein
LQPESRHWSPNAGVYSAIIGLLGKSHGIEPHHLRVRQNKFIQVVTSHLEDAIAIANKLLPDSPAPIDFIHPWGVIEFIKQRVCLKET